MNQLRKHWDDLRSSLWFIPTLIVAGAVVLAVGLIEVDSPGNGGQLAVRWPRLFGAGAEGSRGLLSAIAGSMITVAGVVFSITVVALTLASSQYTSRILRNFMRDRANQTVLGVFVGVFAYCLVVLRTIRSGDEGAFVPGLAVLVAVLLAFVAIGFLIFFIHHIAASLQATSIIESAATETLRAVDRLFPAQIGEAAVGRADEEQQVVLALQAWTTIPARKTGYIEGIDADALFDLADEQGVVVRMEKGIGEFVIEACPLASVSGKPPNDETIRKLNAAYSVGRHRTVHQDAGYGIRQIVDIALKALSPGINDTTTAVNCVDYLGSILARLAARRIESPYRSEGGQLRVITRGPTFPSLMADAFDQIRQNAEGNVAVLARLLQVLTTLAGRTSDEQRRHAIHQQADLVAETAERSVPSAHDRATILTPNFDRRGSDVASARSRRLHPTSIRTRAAHHPKAHHPKVTAADPKPSRSRVGPDTHPFPASRPFKVRLARRAFASRPVRRGSRLGQASDWLLHHSHANANIRAWPASHPGVRRPRGRVPPVVHRFVDLMNVRPVRSDSPDSAPR